MLEKKNKPKNLMSHHHNMYHIKGISQRTKRLLRLQLYLISHYWI